MAAGAAEALGQSPPIGQNNRYLGSIGPIRVLEMVLMEYMVWSQGWVCLVRSKVSIHCKIPVYVILICFDFLTLTCLLSI